MGNKAENIVKVKPFYPKYHKNAKSIFTQAQNNVLWGIDKTQNVLYWL